LTGPAAFLLFELFLEFVESFGRLDFGRNDRSRSGFDFGWRHRSGGHRGHRGLDGSGDRSGRSDWGDDGSSRSFLRGRFFLFFLGHFGGRHRHGGGSGGFLGATSGFGFALLEIGGLIGGFLLFVGLLLELFDRDERNLVFGRDALLNDVDGVARELIG
jgi:hypothetical protein